MGGKITIDAFLETIRHEKENEQDRRTHVKKESDRESGIERDRLRLCAHGVGIQDHTHEKVTGKPHSPGLRLASGLLQFLADERRDIRVGKLHVCEKRLGEALRILVRECGEHC